MKEMSAHVMYSYAILVLSVKLFLRIIYDPQKLEWVYLTDLSHFCLPKHITKEK